jgi:protein-tyrosine phosphatase
MFDLHSHILPGIDDGALNRETSMAMLKIATDHGTTGIVATPHVIEGTWLPAWDKIVADCSRLQMAARDTGINLPIFPGAEVAINLAILKKVARPGQYCINAGRYMLVELPAQEIPRFTDEFFFVLQTRGITPILAHPERNSEIAKHPTLLLEWVRKGILMQINGSSLTGCMGQRVMATAELLLGNNMAHIIGSDAHSTRNRNPNLGPTAVKISSLVGQERAQQILVVNPDHILNSRDVEVSDVSAIIYPQKASGIKRWLSKF